MNVLVVDDDELVRRFVTRALTALECRVTTAANTDEALRAFSTNPFKVAFVDVQIGGESGIRLACTLRALNPMLKIVIMTGNPDKEDEVVASGLGPVLAKPFSSDDIEARFRILKITHSQ